MKISQIAIQDISGIVGKLSHLAEISPQLILVFGCVEHFSHPDFFRILKSAFPAAEMVGCTTAGEISSAVVSNSTSIITAIHFESASFQVATAELKEMDASFQAGKVLAHQLQSSDLKAVMLFGQGVNINGSALIEGMVNVLGTSLPVTGGLAGDDGAFSKTFILSPQGVSTSDVVAIGLKGEKLLFSHGSFGGWRAFGPTRKVTKCVGNVLYELDGNPALDVYKRYLGDYAKDLPGSGLLFPFEMLGDSRESLGQIRTILGINEGDGSLILAGAINPDGYLRLMHAHTNDLVDGAEMAAHATVDGLPSPSGQSLGLLVSCVGRKLVMGGRVDEEVEAVQDILGKNTVLCGFYSNGEICPGYKLEACSLHNQTMTITYLAELS
ncbi:FIST C-terminal domain-containing protein [Undibacterium jejuense]|uniref:FIST C-terminal domain-containing protein n=1 Tax=Undibacterium jejuense TaxID=1344949 RepID=A0A923HIG7_9BURK|nr:FIST N-terminal domain-containing protein [Undibacterium jejuense]MBC3863635.1 FIST C-terminal domain-containing protein [Undibacterium jejuense]